LLKTQPVRRGQKTLEKIDYIDGLAGIGEKEKAGETPTPMEAREWKQSENGLKIIPLLSRGNLGGQKPESPRMSSFHKD